MWELSQDKQSSFFNKYIARKRNKGWKRNLYAQRQFKGCKSIIICGSSLDPIFKKYPNFLKNCSNVNDIHEIRIFEHCLRNYYFVTCDTGIVIMLDSLSFIGIY